MRFSDHGVAVGGRLSELRVVGVGADVSSVLEKEEKCSRRSEAKQGKEWR